MPPPSDHITLARTVLERSPVFSSLPKQVLDKLAKSVRHEDYREPTLINAAGTPLGRLRYVVHGHIVYRPLTPSGSYVESNSIGSEQWYSWGQVLGECLATQDVWTSPEAAYLSFPSKLVQAIAQDHPTIYPNIIQAMHRRFTAAQDFIWQRALGDDEKTLAQLLLVNCAMGERHLNIQISITQMNLGKLMGWPRQKVSRILNSLAAHKLITHGYGTVTVLDQRKLQAFVN